MFQKTKGPFEHLAVRHTEIIDEDKVRYRVYRSPTEYIAVIAENALMAMKLSGVSEPFKVVRDLLQDGGAIEAARLRESEDMPQVRFSITPPKPEDQKEWVPNLIIPETDEPFTPMPLRDLKQKQLADEQVVAASSLMKHIEIDPIAYALATRSDEALRVNQGRTAEPEAPTQFSAPMPPVAAAAPIVDLPEMLPEEVQVAPPTPEPEPVMQEAAPTPAPELPVEPAVTISDEALPVDEIARLLAEPRS